MLFYFLYRIINFLLVQEKYIMCKDSYVQGYYPGHQVSAGQSCGASGPAVIVCGSVCDQRARLSGWRGRGSGNGSPRGNA